MAIVNQKKRPRLLFIGFDREEFDPIAVSNIAPTVDFRETYELEQVRQAEYDVIICQGLEERYANSLSRLCYVVIIGGDGFPSYQHKPAQNATQNVIVTNNSNTSYAKEMVVPDELAQDIKLLVAETLLPKLTDNNSNKIYSAHARTASGYKFFDLLKPIVADGDNNSLAAYYPPEMVTKKEIWCLPEFLDNSEIVKWIKVLIKRWGQVSPEILEDDLDWTKSDRWTTKNERTASEGIIDNIEQFDAQLKKHEDDLQQLKNSADYIKKSADVRRRVLLEGQGDALKDQVATVLSEFGFTVTDKDGTGKKGDLLEDLELSTQFDQTKWTAIVEVRGYKRGAAVSDLQRLHRMASRYEKANPSISLNARFYIVNHDFETLPDKRMPALRSNPEDVEVFSEDNGVVIDTLYLYSLWLDYNAGIISEDVARRLLISAQGYFEYSRLL